MKAEVKIPGTEDAWDTGALGTDANFVSAMETDASDEAVIDGALELQPISIRLQKSLIEDFKLIADLSGLGYQPLMRQVLARFAECEKKRILREVAAQAAERKKEESKKSGGALKNGTTG